MTDFGTALQALKTGKRIARRGWNGKGMFVHLNPGSVHGIVKSPLIEGVHPRLFEAGDRDTTTRMPNLNLRAADGSTVTGWLASQTDLLAEDWEIL
ncbi:DUF2829 domain-containing protein [Pararhizobium qamdonense]|uniref:DUF2829 domain-containing protein n=1 Tax=Pararhizobium qamdonense TaxID=3031126 RepID=UPI0023E239DF|nr:DUF2829 domain-containing protein [Pararhizobium qamdonense]